MSYSAAEISVFSKVHAALNVADEYAFLREDGESPVFIGIFFNEKVAREMKLHKIDFEDEEDVDITKLKVCLNKKKDKLKISFGSDGAISKMISGDFASWTSVLLDQLTIIEKENLFSCELSLDMSQISKIIVPAVSAEVPAVSMSAEAVEELVDILDASPFKALLSSSVKQTLAIKSLNNVVRNTISIAMSVLGVNDPSKFKQIEDKCNEADLMTDSKKFKADKGAGKINAFIVFCNEKRKQVKEANPEAKMGEITKILGEEWKKLSDEDKKPYKVKCDAENEERAKNPAASKKASKKASTKKDKKSKHTCTFRLSKGPNAGKVCGVGVKSEDPNHEDTYLCSTHLKQVVGQKKKEDEEKPKKKKSKKSDDEKPKKKAKKEESDAEDEEEKPKKKKVKKTEEEKPKKKAKKEESDDEEEEKPKKVKKVKKTEEEEKPKKKAKKEESDDEEEEEEKPKKLNKKEVKSVLETKELSDDEDEEEEEEDEPKSEKKSSKKDESDVEEDSGEYDEDLMVHLLNRMKHSDLLAKCKNGPLVDDNNIVWDRVQRNKPYGRWADGKVVPFNKKEKMTVEIWQEDQ